MPTALVGNRFELRRWVFWSWWMVGVYDETGQCVLRVNHGKFKRIVFEQVNGDPDGLEFQANGVLDQDRAYRVMEGVEGRQVGSLEREGHPQLNPESEWIVTGANGVEIGRLKEVLTKGMFWKSVKNIFGEGKVYEHEFVHEGQRLARLQIASNFVQKKMTVDFDPFTGKTFDRRLIIGLGVIVLSISGRTVGSTINYDHGLDWLKKKLFS